MKRPTNYKPKYSLSIKYLRMIMSASELRTLVNKYVEAKVANWGKYKK